jgi:hypothetical protein
LSRATRQPRPADTEPSEAGYTPTLDGVGDSAPAYPLGTGYVSLLKWHPERWHVMHGHLIPQTSGFPLMAGVNNVRRTRDGRWIIREATAQAAERGWRILPTDVDGPGTSYISDSIGTYRWQKRHPGSSVIATDERAYAAWMSGLIARGVIEPIRPYVAERIAEQIRQQIGQTADLVAQGTPSAAPFLERLRADLAVVERALGVAA